jgi:hypothetical protein
MHVILEPRGRQDRHFLTQGNPKEKRQWTLIAAARGVEAGPAALDLQLDLTVVPARAVPWPMLIGFDVPSATPSPVEGRLADHPAGEKLYPWQMLP